MGYYGQGNLAPFVPNPNWMTEREQLLKQQLLQERQQYEAWRASQAKANPQPQPQMTSAGPVQVEGLHQHLADPPLPRGTTLG